MAWGDLHMIKELWHSLISRPIMSRLSSSVINIVVELALQMNLPNMATTSSS